MANSSTIIQILNELSEVESSECSDLEEQQVDDSDEDPDYVPYEQNSQIEVEFSEVVKNIENPPIPPKQSRKRKNISTSETEINDGQIEQECESNKHIITIPNTSKIFGKNGFEWKTECELFKGKVSQRNLVHIRPGPSPTANSSFEPKECFKLFFTDDLINLELTYTNHEIQRQRENYKDKTSANLSDLNLPELKALFGLLILAAALKNNHLTTQLLFDSSFCGNRYRSTMSEKRFCFLINCLRFDDRTTRLQRKNETRLAPISVIWDILMINCRNSYKPSSYVTIDEQLVGFRGRCPFRMYIPSKPTRYGIKIIMMCDNSTKYVVDAIPYTGKGTVPDGQVASDFYVKKLVTSIKGSNRNITMDNWFSNVPLILSLLNEDKLTVIGTIKKNKRELPTQFTDLKFQNRTSDTSFFLYHKDLTIVSYKPNKKKLVTLISSAHQDNSIDPLTKKPEIVLNYNSTKGGVDSFDQMTNNMNCSRKTKRWPLCFFYNMLNIANVNAYVIYTHNFYKTKKTTETPMSRLQFMLSLHKELTEEWQRQRLTLPKISRELKTNIQTALGETPVPSDVKSQHGPRKYCDYCSYKKRRFTTTYCIECQKPICGEHQIKKCLDC